jgi:ubiquinone/menaquinone biosynthesis C-methylase UbiE
MKLFQGMLEHYRKLEPGDTDAWSPLAFEKEVWHRNRIFQQLREGLVAAKADVTRDRFFDVGCGVGRSTRTLLEFGISAAQISGLDLRAEAISAARRAHPGIEFVSVDALDEYRGGNFDWVMQCTVFSSLRTEAERSELARFMIRVTRPGGHIFWWDRQRANDFAGADVLVPERYFADCETRYTSSVSIRPMLTEAIRGGRWTRGLELLQDRLGFPRSHRAALFRTPRK